MAPSISNLAKSRLITTAEVAKHTTPSDCWIIIDGWVYDVTEYVKQHPGGDLIYQGSGKDCTAVFLSTHPMHVRKYLTSEEIKGNYCIGRVQEPLPGESSAVDAGSNYDYDDPVYDEMKKEVEEWLRNRKLSGQDVPLMYIKSIASLALFFVCWYLTCVQGYVLAAFVFGYSVFNIGVNIMHDANHGAYSRNLLLQRLAALSLNLIGGNASQWRIEHQMEHHFFTNTEHDTDTNHHPMFRFRPDQPHCSYHRFQHIYAYLAYCFVSFRWLVTDVNFHLARLTTFEGALQVLFKMFAFSLYVVPFFTLPLSRALLVMAIFFAVSSFCLAVVFSVNHVNDKVQFVKPGKSGKLKWGTYQVLTSMNWSAGSPFWNHMSGGLNHQVEHHLFPSICHLYYPEISRIVQRVCKKHGVPYYNADNLWDAMKCHFRHLYNLSRP